LLLPDLALLLLSEPLLLLQLLKLGKLLLLLLADLLFVEDSLLFFGGQLLGDLISPGFLGCRFQLFYKLLRVERLYVNIKQLFLGLSKIRSKYIFRSGHGRFLTNRTVVQYNLPVEEVEEDLLFANVEVVVDDALFVLVFAHFFRHVNSESTFWTDCVLLQGQFAPALVAS